jgi:hypothetical protein
MDMKKRVAVLTGMLFFAVVSCMVITVNIYFPEKEAEEAFKILEKELMPPEGEKQEPKPDAKPESSINPAPFSGVFDPAERILLKTLHPHSTLRSIRERCWIKFELVTSAYAQEPGLSEKIAEMVKKMPDVVNAYKEMGARIADLDKLRDSGAVGIGNSGMLVFRDEKLLSPDQKKLVSAENESRKTIINGMAKAIIRINRAPENEQNLKQVMPQAAKLFAAIRQEAAKKGWWIQSPDGNWSRK